MNTSKEQILAIMRLIAEKELEKEASSLQTGCRAKRHYNRTGSRGE